MTLYVCAYVDRVGSVLGLVINPWARAVLHSQTDRLSPLPAPVTRARSNKPLQRDRTSRNVRFTTRRKREQKDQEKHSEAEAGKGLCKSIYVCECYSIKSFFYRAKIFLFNLAAKPKGLWNCLASALPLQTQAASVQSLFLYSICGDPMMSCPLSNLCGAKPVETYFGLFLIKRNGTALMKKLIKV